MNFDALVPPMTNAMLKWEHLMQVAGVRPVFQAVTFLSGTSGAFWFISHVCGLVAVKVHAWLDYSLAVVFAVFYNAGLAVLFGGVMAAAVVKVSAGGDWLMAYEAGGFIFTYFVLGMAYLSSEGKLDDYTVVGYFAGLATFVAGCVHQSLLAHPALATAHETVSWIVSHALGKTLLGLFALQGFAWRLQGLRRWLYFKSFKVGKKRFFFSMAF
jgi:hypothetical protein